MCGSVDTNEEHADRASRDCPSQGLLQGGSQPSSLVFGSDSGAGGQVGQLSSEIKGGFQVRSDGKWLSRGSRKQAHWRQTSPWDLFGGAELTVSGGS